VPGPQPRQYRRREQLALVATVFNNLPKIHPEFIKSCQPDNASFDEGKYADPLG